MTSSRPSFDPATEDQAALWAARLEGSTLSADDRAAMESWLAENPGRRALLSSYCQFSADLEKHLPALVATGTVTMPTKAASARRWSWGWLTIGSLATAAGAAAIIWFVSPSPTGKFATPVGQRQSLTLEDGTKVELNARTQLLVLQTEKDRRVRLIEGEAFFMVSKDSAHPFIVETPAGSVRVTGTRFDVRTEVKSELEVTVDEGSVQVQPSGNNTPATQTVRLVAGDQFTQAADGAGVRRVLSSEEVENALAWRRGQVIFDRTPMKDALAKFARFHGREITVTVGAANLAVGGIRSLDDLEAFLDDLQQTQPIRITPGVNGAIRVSLKNER